MGTHDADFFRRLHHTDPLLHAKFSKKGREAAAAKRKERAEANFRSKLVARDKDLREQLGQFSDGLQAALGKQQDVYIKPRMRWEAEARQAAEARRNGMTVEEYLHGK